MTPIYNLIDEPWITVERDDGTPGLVGLETVLCEAHRLRAIIDPSPLVVIALYRLLLAVLHRVFGPASEDAWAALYAAGQFPGPDLRRYLDTYRARFYLLHDTHPFYQAVNYGDEPGFDQAFTNDSKVRPIRPNKLVPERAAGNNATVFDHTFDATASPLPFAMAARALVSLQRFHLGGLLAAGLPNFTDAPAARSIQFALTGETVWETLVLNLVQYDGDEPLPRLGEDLPWWEQESWITDATPRGYLDYLTWQSVRVRLDADEGGVRGAHWTVGRKFRDDQAVRDPACSYREDKTRGVIPIRYQRDRALWRDSASLFRVRAGTGGRAPQAPGILRWASRLVEHDRLPRGRDYRVTAFGMATKQTRIDLWRSEHMPVPAALLADEQMLERLEIAVESAETRARALNQTGYFLACDILFPGQDDLTKAQKKTARNLLNGLGIERGYWPSLEPRFFAFMGALITDGDKALTDWETAVSTAARDAFKDATSVLEGQSRTLWPLAKAQTTLERTLATT